MRIYRKAGDYLNDLGDNEFRLFRALLLFSDCDDGCVHLYVKPIKIRLVHYAYAGILDTDYNYRRRFHRAMSTMEDRGLVCRFRTGHGKSAMVNPLVGYMADYRWRKLAIKKWKEVMKSNKNVVNTGT